MRLSPGEPEPPVIEAAHRARARFTKNRAALSGAAIVIFLLLFAVFGPVFSDHDPYVSDYVNGVSAAQDPVGPSRLYWLGTDRIFRDELARLAYGARISLFIGVLATLIASTIGAGVGVVAGYYEGRRALTAPWIAIALIASSVPFVIFGHERAALAVLGVGALFLAASEALRRRGRGKAWLLRGADVSLDSVLMRLVDVGLAFPFLLLVMALGAALEKTTVTTILVTLGLTGWLGTARVIRAKTIQIRSLDFVVASRALGQGTLRILLLHVLPNVTGPLIVIATVSVAQMIVAESVLSYLGVGISPPTPTWGHMLFEGQDYYTAAPWLLLAPATAIMLAVFGFNLLGEGLRDALDPKQD